MILLVDNYDSFTFNLYQMLAVHLPVQVARNDAADLASLLRSASGVVVSPGPGRPESTGLLPGLLGDVMGRVPVLGVCLGHQLLGLLAGAEVVRHTPVHGKTSLVHNDGLGLYLDLPSEFRATRYHSLVVRRETLQPSWQVSATADDGTVMGIRSPDGMSEGVQFHPESIATEVGARLLENFARRCAA